MGKIYEYGHAIFTCDETLSEFIGTQLSEYLRQKYAD